MEIQLGTYRHYKGNIYRVIALAKHSETLEDMVIYQDVKDESKVWARPAAMWNDDIAVEGITVKRFQLI